MALCYIICLFLCMYSAQTERTEFRLSPRNPGYALKDSRLARKKEITIQVNASYDILIDYTVDYCAKEDEVHATVICSDALPFTVNGQVISVSETQRSSTSFDIDEFYFYYSYSLSVRTDTLSIQYVNNTSSQFAIGFRVRQWIDAAANVIFLPFSDAGLYYYIPAGTIVVFVADEDERLTIEASAEHGAVSVQNGVYGSSNDLLLMNSSYIALLPVRCPVLTVRADSAFNVKPNAEFAQDVTYFEFQSFTYTTPEYGWEFGEAENHRKCSNVSFQNTKTTALVDVLFTDIRGMNLTMRTRENITRIDYDATNLGLNWTMPFKDFLYLSYCPFANATEFGFVVQLDVTFAPPQPAHINSTQIRLTRDNPSISLDGDMLPGKKEQYLFTTDDEMIADLAIDLCVLTNSSILNAIEEFPIRVNNKTVNGMFDFSIPIGRGPVLYCSRITVKSNFTLVQNLDSDFVAFGFTVSIAKYLPTDAQVISVPVQNENTMGFEFPRVERKRTFLVLTDANMHFYLEKLRWDRPNKDCAYNLYIGPIPSQDRASEKLLTTYRDSDSFTTQPLLSPVFTVEIPAGCQPSIAFFEVIFEYSKSTTEFCEGSIFVVTPLFADAFDVLFSRFYNPFVLKNSYSCSSFELDVELEIVRAISGNLSIATSGSANSTTSIQLDPQLNGENFAFEFARNLTIEFTTNDTTKSSGYSSEGFFGRLHAKHRAVTATSTTKSSATTATSSGNCHHRILFIFGLFYVLTRQYILV